MGLYVRDESVNRLAEKLRRTLGAKTKTDAVRTALEHMLREAEQPKPLRARLKRIQAATLALGTPDPDFDEKAYADSMWGQG